jgi:Fe-S cluster biogenesis protein NfuA
MEQPVGTDHEQGARAAGDLRLVAERIDTIVREAGEFADPRARGAVEELVHLLMDLYGAGLARVLSIAGDRSGGGPRLLEALCEDDLVSSLLILHGLHPVDLETRVRRGLARVQSMLEGRGGRLELVAANEAVVRVTLDAGGDGCGSSGASWTQAVEQAIANAAPDARAIEVDLARPRAPEPALIQIHGLKRNGER